MKSKVGQSVAPQNLSWSNNFLKKVPINTCMHLKKVILVKEYVRLV